MEGADPHAAGAHRQHGRQAGEHFLGGFVGKCNRQNAGRIDLTGTGSARRCGWSARGSWPEPAPARRMLPRKGDGLELFGVEIGEQRGHRGSFSNPDCIGSAAHDRSRALKRQCCTATTAYLQGSVNQLDCSCALHNKSPESVEHCRRPAGSELRRIKENKRAQKLYCATTLTMDWPSMKQPADEGAVPRPEWRTHHENAETAALVCPQGGRPLERAETLAQSRT